MTSEIIDRRDEEGGIAPFVPYAERIKPVYNLKHKRYELPDCTERVPVKLYGDDDIRDCHHDAEWRVTTHVHHKVEMCPAHAKKAGVKEWRE